MMRTAARLYEIQSAIIRLKREAKRQWGKRRDDWPPYVLARYEALKDEARGHREQLGEAA